MTKTLGQAKVEYDEHRDRLVAILEQAADLDPRVWKEMLGAIELGLAVGQVLGQLVILEAAVKDLIQGGGVPARLMKQIENARIELEGELRGTDPSLPSTALPEVRP
jgi:hypothetical protein